MKYLGIIWAIWIFAYGRSVAQNTQAPCRDVVFLKDGSVLRGKIDSLVLGAGLTMTTWSGMKITLNGSMVKKIEQRCKDEKGSGNWAANNSFKARAWYNATHFAVLSGESDLGLGAQSSIGYRYNRWLSAGLGSGIESFSVNNLNALTIPVFAEYRCFILPGSISPFVSIAGGYGIHHQKKSGDVIIIDSATSENWKGGWMAQGQLGCRVGSHFMMQLGLRFQKQVRNWKNNWNFSSGKDTYLLKRLDVGIGVML